MFTCFVVILAFLVRMHLALQIFTTVNITNGPVTGISSPNLVEPHRSYYSFKGIPFSKPPLGVLRFQPPSAPDNWVSPRLAVTFGNQCPQTLASLVIGSEDCLTLNVFTPQVKCTLLKPVMFYIHGSGFTSSGSFLFGPDRLMNEDVVLVTFNYRLSILGFLSVGDQNAFGNAGLQDAVAALRWVHENIANFCGDPDKVTLSGQSSGAYMVEYLQVSPLTTGYFHQVIGFSGSALNRRSLQRHPMQYVYNLANYLGVDNSSTSYIVQGFQEVGYDVLIRAAANNQATGFQLSLDSIPFAPVIEVNHPGAVMSQSVYESLENGYYNHVPFMHGHTNGDGSLGMSYIDANNMRTEFDTSVKSYIPSSLNLPQPIPQVGQEIRNYFLGNSSASDNALLTEYLTSDLFARGITKAVEFKRRTDTGYFYIFNYEGLLQSSSYPGTGHGDDMLYLFFTFPLLTPQDIFMAKRYTRLVANFVSTGNPIQPSSDDLLDGVEWPQVNSTSFGYLTIGSQLSKGYSPNNHDLSFWIRIFETYGVPPFYNW